MVCIFAPDTLTNGAFPHCMAPHFTIWATETHLLSPDTLKVPDGYSGLDHMSSSNGSDCCFRSLFCLLLHSSNGQLLKRTSLLLQCFHTHCLIKRSQFLRSGLNRILLGNPVHSRSYRTFSIVFCGAGRLRTTSLWCDSKSCALLSIENVQRMIKNEEREKEKLDKKRQVRKMGQGVKITGEASNQLEVSVGWIECSIRQTWWFSFWSMASLQKTRAPFRGTHLNICCLSWLTRMIYNAFSWMDRFLYFYVYEPHSFVLVIK